MAPNDTLDYKALRERAMQEARAEAALLYPTDQPEQRERMAEEIAERLYREMTTP